MSMEIVMKNLTTRVCGALTLIAMSQIGCEAGGIDSGFEGSVNSAGMQGEHGQSALMNPSDEMGGSDQQCHWDGSCNEGFVCLGVCTQESTEPGAFAGPCYEDESCQKGLECRAGVCADVERLVSVYNEMTVEAPDDILAQTGFLTLGQELEADDIQSVGKIESARRLTSYLPRVGNQGNQGSCISWAVGYGLATYMFAAQRRRNPSGNSEYMSPAYLHNQNMGYQNCTSGQASFEPADNVLSQQGIVPLSVMGYTTNANGCTERVTDAMRQQAAPHRMRGNLILNKMNALVTSPSPPTRDVVSASEFQQIKASISRGVPVAVAIRTYAEFMSLGSQPQRTMTPRTDTTLGHNYHAVLVVGYDDARGIVTVMNSWQRSWGRGGYGEISYDVFTKITGLAYWAAPVQDASTPTPAADVPTSTPAAPSTSYTCQSVTLGRNVPANTCIQIDSGRGCSWHRCVAQNDYTQVNASLPGCEMAYAHPTCQQTTPPEPTPPSDDPAPQPEQPTSRRGQLVATLSWNARADLDISASEPSGTFISHSHSTSSPNDGSRSECNPVSRGCQLSDNGTYDERIVWGASTGNVQGGIYRFYASNYTGGTLSYTLKLERYDSNGRLTFERTDQGTTSSSARSEIIAIDLRQ